ncbi:MAG TPA: heavy metal-associated domain-containing protein [Gelidibacter sp.]|uniref:heavy-metal-associated domain-containing protein n=1 Tax=Gelidibacter sp. TaxID=2018083 RepID=UPI002CFBBDD2|nr:heavy metal-associated domain-containing protein [Gelidibacter sp.]HXJ98794.1 heavy metal-associated domain-containing protein [Gelidibacter sp.]
MKTLKTFALFTVILFFLGSCKNEVQPEIITVDMAQPTTVSEKQLDPSAIYAKVEFGIDGMTCEMGCAKTIEKKLAKMEGVKTVVVDFDRHLAMVEYDSDKVTPLALETTVESVGGDTYTVKDMKTVEAFSVE